MAKKTTKLILFFHKNKTKLVFLWPNMSQKSFKVLTIKIKIPLFHYSYSYNVLQDQKFFWPDVRIAVLTEILNIADGVRWRAILLPFKIVNWVCFIQFMQNSVSLNKTFTTTLT